MSKSRIEWTTDTWNPIVGCSLVSPGCTHCYAMAMAARIEAINAEARASGKTPAAPQYDGTTRVAGGRAVWTGRVAPSRPQVLTSPLKRTKPTTFFVNSMGDLFHEDVPDEDIDAVFAVMALTLWHTYQILTKRDARMLAYMTTPGREIRIAEAIGRLLEDTAFRHLLSKQRPDNWRWPLPNVWLGVSTEDQPRYDARKSVLRATPAAVRFFSMEPLLGPIVADYLADGILVGGESGHDARPMHPAWPRSLRDQCAAASVPFFFKQWGAHLPAELIKDGIDPETPWRIDPNGRVFWDVDELSTPKASWPDVTFHKIGKSRAGRMLDGVEHNALPGDHRLAKPAKKSFAMEAAK